MQALAWAIDPAARVHRQAAPSLAPEDALIDDAAALPPGEAAIRLWINPPCLVTTRRLAARDAFAAAARASGRAGWPVLVRSSGGTTVAHGPGVLNVSLAFIAAAPGVAIELPYRRLAQRLVPALARLGVAAEMGCVPGSYCDGRFNLRAAGQNVGGAACRIGQRGGRTAVLVHAALLVEGDPAMGLAAVAALEQGLGLPADYRAGAHVTLAKLGAVPDPMMRCERA
jgi:lipoate-protein ligase A